jgi:uncharacterized protein
MQYTYSVLGGALIGLSASLVLFTHGRVAGVSGIFAGFLRREPDEGGFRWTFLLGLCASGLFVRIFAPSAFGAFTTAAGADAGAGVVSAVMPSLPVALASGLLVGFGTQMGSGCTSGHGVCGVSRLSVRSMLATLVFIATGMLTVFLVRHFSPASATTQLPRANEPSAILSPGSSQVRR